MTAAKVDLSVVAPVFDEEESIERVVKGWDAVLTPLPLRSEIVVTDDGSADRTPELLARLQGEVARLRVVTHGRNRGYGRALATAVTASRGDWLVTIDSDGQFDLDDALALLERAREGDLDGVVGFRRGKQDSLVKVAADRLLNRLVRLLFGLSFRDTNCALKVVRGDRLRGLYLEASGYPSPTEIAVKLAATGARLEELGVRHLEREAGSSKLKVLRTGLQFLRFLFYLRGKLGLYRRGIIHTL